MNMNLFFFKVIRISFLKALFDIKNDNKKNLIGILWWIIEPLFYFLAFYIFFKLVLQRDIGQLSFFFIGIAFWKLFSSTIQMASISILHAKPIWTHNKIFKPIFPLSKAFYSFFKFLFVLIILLIFLNSYISITWLWLFFILFVFFIFSFSIALIFSLIIPFFFDIKIFLDNTLLFLFFLSGIFYDINQLPIIYQNILFLNPVAKIISITRECILNNQFDQTGSLFLILLMSITLIFLCLFILKKIDKFYGKI